MKRKYILSAGILVVVLLLIGGYFVAKKSLFDKSTQPSTTRGINSINYGKPTQDQVNAGAQIKEKSQDQNGGGSDIPPAPKSIPNSSQKSVSVVITSATQDGSQFLVRTMVGMVTSTGTCSLSIQKDGSQSSINMSSGTQPLASTSTCKGFSIPMSSLSSGSWLITINFSDGNFVGKATKQIII